MKIRRIDPGERVEVSLPIQAYAFEASPAEPGLWKTLADNQEYYRYNVTVVAEEGGVPLGDASAISMRQNLRGNVYSMAGIAGVAVLPEARRRGYARSLVIDLLERMRDEGHALSALHPFRASFYQKFGFVGLPKPRTVTFSPKCFAGLLDAKLAGEVTRQSAADGYPAYNAFSKRLLATRHGFSVLPDYRTVELAQRKDRWIAIAWADGEPVGAVTYRITGFGGTLAADDMLTVNPLGKTLLLQFFARHIDHVAQVEVQVGTDEIPELWTTDMEAVTTVTTSSPVLPSPMARVLSLEGLTGLPVGRERVAVEVIHDQIIKGTYTLDGRSGKLGIVKGGTADAKLSVPGLSGLLYGVLDPEEVELRGFGTVPSAAAAALRTLFPRRSPYLYSRF